ncbi:MAG: anti-sigma factor [Chthoniobacterales bacterium]
MTALTIHDDIETWLPAALDNELSPSERTAFDEHLTGCATCRQLHQEEIAMSKLIENTLAAERPDLGFEQRIISRFRKDVPRRVGLTGLIASLLRTRVTS